MSQAFGTSVCTRSGQGATADALSLDLCNLIIIVISCIIINMKSAHDILICVLPCSSHHAGRPLVISGRGQLSFGILNEYDSLG